MKGASSAARLQHLHRDGDRRRSHHRRRTPEAVIISAFDPVRREIARIALEKPYHGRPHPSGAHQEMVKRRARRSTSRSARPASRPCSTRTCTASTRAGQAPRPDALPHELRPERAAPFRRGQPSGGVMPRSWARGRPALASAGLLHDIGKAIDHESRARTSPSARIWPRSSQKRHGDQRHRRAHHNDVEGSRSRPCWFRRQTPSRQRAPARQGARSKIHIKRLESCGPSPTIRRRGDLLRHPVRSRGDPHHRQTGGRQRRRHALVLAKEIVKRIEKEMEYPETKVNVIAKPARWSSPSKSLRPASHQGSGASCLLPDA